MVSTYSPLVFAELFDFRVAKRRLASEQAKLNRLGEVICRHGLGTSVGIGLLHKHFPLNHDEVLVEEITNSESRTTPQKGFDLSKATPYLWKVADTGTAAPLEFVLSNGNAQQAIEGATRLAENSGFFAEFFAVSKELGVNDLFGVTVLHRDGITLGSDEMLVETSDEASRTLQISATPRNQFPEGELTETLWRFTSEKVGTSLVCYSHCHGHCRAH